MNFPIPPSDADAPDPAGDVTPLVRILELLQGEGTGLTDASIARLPPEHLERLAVAAQRKSQDSLDLLRCLLNCVEIILRREPAETARGSLLNLNGHLAGLLEDHERWVGLHENAVYYRDHPQVAERLARYWKRSWA
ncbi:hypothetical protein [Pseudoxanthomonas mexicana]|uniref:hypothetical protein n=1 Tax=Pseudoxanthomonas mexicana TaxID=128785 RepID=UPI00398B35AF